MVFPQRVDPSPLVQNILSIHQYISYLQPISSLDLSDNDAIEHDSWRYIDIDTRL
jgi:hypothetical protein